MHFDMQDSAWGYTVYTAQIANYFGGGNERTDYPNGGWSWNILSFKIARYKVKIIQDMDIIRQNTRPIGMIPTSEIQIIGVGDFEEGRRVVNDICRILSLASFSQVVPYHYSFRGRAITINITGEAMCFRPLITLSNGNAAKLFIEQVWPIYRRKKKTRKLAELIDMLTIAELPTQPLEIQLANMFIIMENMKSTYARSKKIPFFKGYYRKISSPPKAMNKEQKYTFKELLSMMFDEVGMQPRLKRILNLRNEIIHFGLSRKPYTSLRNDYEYCHDIVREYLLRYLGYRGEYLIYSSAARVIRKI